MQAKQVLHKLLQKIGSQMHKMRRTALAVNVMAALHGEVLTVTQLGRSITSRAKEKHLRASVPLRGQSLTLYEEVHPAKSKEKPTVHRRFLQRLQAMLLPDCRPIMLTDAGFRTPWFKQVEALGWDWVGRIRNRHQLQLGGEDAWIPCKALYDKATPTPKALGPARLTLSNPIVWGFHRVRLDILSLMC